MCVRGNACFSVDTIFSFVQHRDQLAEVLGDQRFQDLVRFVTEEERQCFTTAQSEVSAWQLAFLGQHFLCAAQGPGRYEGAWTIATRLNSHVLHVNPRGLHVNPRGLHVNPRGLVECCSVSGGLLT